MTKYNAYCLVFKTDVSNIGLNEIISKNSYYAYKYALRVLKSRFGLGEKVISKNCYYSYKYAMNVMGYNHA